ncbi:MAG: hypothetical protein IPL61_39410 [Myxococcales bacterium]|nr:hypothetical protein [Myxococcales bacterium]
MAWRSDPRAHVARAIIVAAALAGPARACPDGGLELALSTSRFAIAPTPAQGVGLDLWARGPTGAWGRCAAVGHRVITVEVEAPDVGDRAHTVVHAGGYRAIVHAGDVELELGAYLLTSWADALRFVTPMAAAQVEPAPGLVVRAEVIAAGAAVMARARTPRTLTDDVAISGSAAWPAAAATRGEVRVRLRRYHADDLDRRDLTVTVGLGLALAAHDRARALPGFVGLAVRRGADPAVLVVAELSYGVGGR